MRTNVVIDDKIMDGDLKASGLKTKKDAVEVGQKFRIKINRQVRTRKYRGKLKWSGNLDAMRTE